MTDRTALLLYVMQGAILVATAAVMVFLWWS
jgi:hypothetical protein